MKADIKAWAWRTPLGGDIDTVMRRLLAGDRAAGVNAHFDAASYACTLAATIAAPPQPSRHSRFLRRMGLYALEAAIEAMTSAGLDGGDRVGLFFGYGGLRAHWDDMMPAFERQHPSGVDGWANGLLLLHPFWMLQHLSNNAHALAAQELKARGEGATFGGANAGAQALGAAIRALHAGAIDTALVVAYDSLVEPETLVELAQRGALSTAPLPQLCAPYGQAAHGFIPGEAAAAVVLQRCGENGAAIATLEAADGADGEPAMPHAATLERLLRQLARKGDAIDGAGLAQPAQDLAERRAAAEMAGASAPLCCIMSAMGNLGAATSVVQTIALAESLRRGMLAPIAGLRTPTAGPLRPLIQAEPTSAQGAVGVCVGAPGLAGIVRVALP
ncbi:MAG: beta-ketoacyl synthase N-terminal-like domain-containing protein [Pseudomonadota bacterium]